MPRRAVRLVCHQPGPSPAWRLGEPFRWETEGSWLMETPREDVFELS